MIDEKNGPKKIFDAVAVSSTTTYKSLVTADCRRRCFYTFQSTSTAAGTFTREVNQLSDGAYRVACGFSDTDTPAQRATKEATNTTGWLVQSFLQSDRTNASATAAAAAAAVAPVTVDMPPGPTRSRISYTNSSGSGAITVIVQVS